MTNILIYFTHELQNIVLFVDETPKLQHFSAEVVQKEYCQAVKVIK